MVTEAELREYLDEIRDEVCSHCVERPPGGPPCLPRGKPCGIELHLGRLVEAVRQVHSELIGPYMDHNRQRICTDCRYLHSEHCPCPMDSLALLLVDAIEALDQRHLRLLRGRQVLKALPGSDRPDMAAIARAYEEGAGTWSGCDWPTCCGPNGLRLQGLTAAQAEARAVETAGSPEAEDWEAAAAWLRRIELLAEQAEADAVLAVASANVGAWAQACRHARRAWSLEFQTGRTLRGRPPTWQRLYEVIETAAQASAAQAPACRA